MEINYQLVTELANALEMNGRQYILRDKKIQELKSLGEYPNEHVDDLIYYHIKSSLIRSVLQNIFQYFEFRNESGTSEVAFRVLTEKAYENYKNFETHDKWMERVNSENSG